MKKNNKGFTLIELLVVVAIIGILAAVGTVAYTGYTAGAKKSATKSNHASVVKYIAAEDQKCNIGESKAMGDALICGGTTDADGDAVPYDGTSVTTAAVTALADFKNAYSTGNAAVRNTGTGTADDADMGYVNLDVDDTDTDKITVTTCFQNDCAAATDNIVNTIIVGE